MFSQIQSFSFQANRLLQKLPQVTLRSKAALEVNVVNCTKHQKTYYSLNLNLGQFD